MTVLRIVSGSANPGLASAIANYLGVESDGCSLARFPDGELRPIVENVCGSDVYVIQPTSPPVNEHIVELLLLVDACRRARAARVTVVVPYFGYARQDRRTTPGQALGLAVVADVIAAAGADRLVVVDPHTPALEAVCRFPVETLSAGHRQVVGQVWCCQDWSLWRLRQDTRAIGIRSKSSGTRCGCITVSVCPERGRECPV